MEQKKNKRREATFVFRAPLTKKVSAKADNRVRSTGFLSKRTEITDEKTSDAKRLNTI